MIHDPYKSFALNNKTQFLFHSVGNQGIVLKMIVFVRLEGNRWNVGFGDVTNRKIDDAAFTNNNDVLKVISTVAQAIYTFSEAHPNRVVVINPVDDRRKRFTTRFFSDIGQWPPRLLIFGDLPEKYWSLIPPKNSTTVLNSPVNLKYEKQYNRRTYLRGGNEQPCLRAPA